MVEIAKCRMCGNQGEPTGLDFSGGHYVKCSGTRCCYGPSRATKAEAIAAWNELMQPGTLRRAESDAKCGHDPILLERAWLAARAYGDFGGTLVVCSRERFVSIEWWSKAWMAVVCEADENVEHARMTRAFRCFNIYRRSSKQLTYSRAEFDACAPSLREAWAKMVEVISPRQPSHAFATRTPRHRGDNR